MNNLLKMALLFSIALDLVVTIAVSELWIKLFAIISLVIVVISVRQEIKR